jgi:NAD(P)-dependent dehydrogenase (short-subunit alcohol dehydrogenase family)
MLLNCLAVLAVLLSASPAAAQEGHLARSLGICRGHRILPELRALRRAKAAGRTRQDLDREATEGCLLGRWADPREVAYPILWLASDEASYVTGSVCSQPSGSFSCACRARGAAKAELVAGRPRFCSHGSLTVTSKVLPCTSGALPPTQRPM